MSKDDKEAKAPAEPAANDPRPQTQIEGERLSAESDAADPRLQGSGWLPGGGAGDDAKADEEAEDKEG